MSSCIYTITRVVEGKSDKIYIGSAVDYKKRFNQHKSDLRKGIHVNNYLQNSWNKYGEKAFKFEILEFVEDIDVLIEREQYYLDLYQTFAPYGGFNILKDAGSVLGYKHSEESLKKIKKSSAEYYKTNPSPFKGKHHTDEAKNGMSKKRKGKQVGEDNPFFGKTHSKETLEKMSKSKGGFTVDDILDIRERSSKGETNVSIAKFYNVSKTTIGLIVGRRTWKHI